MSSDQTGAPADGDTAEATAEVVEEVQQAGEAGETGEAGEAVDIDRVPGGVRRALDWCRARRVAVLLAALLLVSAGVAGSVYWWIYRPDQLTNATAQTEATDAAREGTIALLSYAPDTIDKDLEKAKSYLTGPFLQYYGDFTTKIVAPAARQKGVKTEATVVRAAVSEMHPDKAVVLVFVNQVSMSKERPDPTLANSSVLVTMVRKDGRWLISEFNPV